MTFPRCTTPPTCSCWRPADTTCSSKDSVSPSWKRPRVDCRSSPAVPVGSPKRYARARPGCSWIPTILRRSRPRPCACWATTACGDAWVPPGERRWRPTTTGIGSRPTSSGSTGSSGNPERIAPEGRFPLPFGTLVRKGIGDRVMTTMLLAQDFPPMGGGIARMHSELARRFPRGELIVSTPADPDAPEADGPLDAVIDRLPISARRTKSLPGLLLWARRAASLARQHRIRYVHCGNIKPAGYPARWVFERCRVPYGIYFHGGDLLSEQHKIRQSAFKGRTAKVIFGGAAVLMANSTWTRD